MKKRTAASLLAVALTLGWTQVASAAHYPFSASDGTAGGRTSEFWNIYGVAEGPANANGYRFGANTAWQEWDAMKFSWTNYGGYRTDIRNWLLNNTKINGLNGVTGVQANGYVWSWSNVYETWPDALPNPVGSYHFDQIPRYINAAYLHYMWTRDATFLGTVLPRLEYVMDNYLLNTMQGNTNVAIIPIAANNGTSTGDSSTYMDQLRSGYKDGWINTAFYSSLLNMAELEDAAGNTAKSNTYAALAAAFPAKYDTAFWNGSTNRYAGWRDVNGNLHDAGYTFVNLEALSRGLGNLDKAHRIFDWLDNPSSASPTVAGAHVGSTNPYQLVFAPRTNTSPVPLSDWEPWSNPPAGKKPYGSIIQDGGGVLFLNYYDVMARLKYFNADNAFVRYNAMLKRMAGDPYKLTFAGDRAYNSYGEDWVEVGTNAPFPESGISALSFLNGFMGVNAKKSGLAVQPNLPVALVYAQAADVHYKGTNRTIKVSRGDIVTEQPSNNAVEGLTAGNALHQTFTTTGPFNEVGIVVGTYGTTTSDLTMQLDKNVGGVWTKVATTRFVDMPDNDWLHMPAPNQAAGTYRISIYDPSGSIAWYKNTTSSYPGTAYKNGTALTGDFMFHVVQGDLTTIIDQQSVTTPAPLTTSLGQVFETTVPFNRVSMCIATYLTDNSGFTASLYQDVGGRWKVVQRQHYSNVKDNAEVVMAFSTQMAGKYRLEIAGEVGSIAWYSNTSDVLPGTNNFAIENGWPVAGDRWIKVYRGKNRIEVPALGVNTVIDAGDTYTMTN